MGNGHELTTVADELIAAQTRAAVRDRCLTALRRVAGWNR